MPAWPTTPTPPTTTRRTARASWHAARAAGPAPRGGDGGWRIVGGLQKDGGLARFFSFLNLFVFSMLVLVLAQQLPDALRRLGTGGPLLLPAHRLLVPEARHLPGRKGFLRKDVPFEAAKKAFIVNRIGDFGFALG